MTLGVLNVRDVVRSLMALNVLEDTNSSDIVTTLDEDRSTVVKFDHAIDFISLEV